MNLTQSASLVVLAGCTLNASAGITVIDNEAAFLASLVDPVFTESYESYTPDVQLGARTIGLDQFSVQFNGADEFGVTDVVQPEFGVITAEGDQHLRANFGGGETVSTTFSFNQPATAFGTYLTDLEVANMDVSVELANGQSFSTLISVTGDGGMTYFGINPGKVGINSVTFTMNSSSTASLDGVFFDRTTITIPAPAPTALLASAGLITTRRRR